MQQRFRRLVLPSLVVFLFPAPLPAEILERVVAKVNGDIVTLTDFQARQLAAAQAARISPERVEAFLRQQNAKILQDAVDELLLTQRANDLGMRMRPEVVRDIIEGIKKENNLETDAQLQEQLRREGMSMDDLKRSIERSIQRRQVLQREIEPKIAVSEEDSYAEYQKKKAEFAKPATVTLEEILVEGEDAREKAEALVARARAGEDFAALARAYSKAPSAKNGGELGKLAQGEINPELEKQAFALAKGAISDPIPQGAGYRILKISDKTEASVVPYEEAKKDIRARLGEERIEKEYQAYMATLRDKAVGADPGARGAAAALRARSGERAARYAPARGRRGEPGTGRRAQGACGAAARGSAPGVDSTRCRRTRRGRSRVHHHGLGRPGARRLLPRRPARKRRRRSPRSRRSRDCGLVLSTGLRLRPACPQRPSGDLRPGGRAARCAARRARGGLGLARPRFRRGSASAVAPGGGAGRADLAPGGAGGPGAEAPSPRRRRALRERQGRHVPTRPVARIIHEVHIIFLMNGPTLVGHAGRTSSGRLGRLQDGSFTRNAARTRE